MQHKYGITGEALAWVSSYLSERKQSVKIGSDVSAPNIMKYGVPQGSVLGPLLFSMYIAPLFEITQKWGLATHQYADDSQIYATFTPRQSSCTATTLKQLEGCIMEIGVWMCKNKLKLNDSKTEVVIFKPSQMN